MTSVAFHFSLVQSSGCMDATSFFSGVQRLTKNGSRPVGQFLWSALVLCIFFSAFTLDWVIRRTSGLKKLVLFYLGQCRHLKTTLFGLAITCGQFLKVLLLVLSHGLEVLAMVLRSKFKVLILRTVDKVVFVVFVSRQRSLLEVSWPVGY